ncbi:general stress protein [Komagataeibacter sp. FXV3]|uniref:general stress protein n=1 Tax=Komagataeibacter sp. FXV3 TaxID=2608998 RepID=UPI00187B729A|nr:general stress protein [Komagataeibacter sp. FXV3]MBE7728876.1 hypothetical protein [Komagataeibacter sp. FXV3]
MSYHISLHTRTSQPAFAPADSRGGGGAAHNPGNFANDPARASEAGHKGGQHSSGNFANNPERAAEAGRKGGQHSHGGQTAEKSTSASTRTGGTHATGTHKATQHGSGNFADDPERAAEAGRKGGQHSHGGKS